MNIMQINTMDTGGGAAKICLTLKKNFESLGNQTSLFVKLKYSIEPNILIAKWPNPLSKFIKKITGKDVGSFFTNKIRPLLSNDIDFFKTDQILKTPEFETADIIHCHNLHGNYFKLETLVKMSKLKPVIWTLHDVWAITPYCARIYSDKQTGGFYKCQNLDGRERLLWDNESYLKEKKRKIYKDLKNVHLVLPSKWLLEKVKKSVLSDKNFSMIYNGVNTEIFRQRNKTVVRASLSLPNDKKIILFLSAIGADAGKGWGHIEKAIEKYSDDQSILFVCIGITNSENRKAYPNVKYLDYIESEEKIATYFSAADLLLFPSLAESFGLVAAEALATGIPAVVFEAGGLPEIIGHKENGYVAKYDDTKDLLAGIEYVFNLPRPELEKIASSSREKAVKLFDEKTMVNNYLKLYQELLSEKH